MVIFTGALLNGEKQSDRHYFVFKKSTRFSSEAGRRVVFGHAVAWCIVSPHNEVLYSHCEMHGIGGVVACRCHVRGFAGGQSRVAAS
jgi:hypothetical protein